MPKREDYELMGFCHNSIASRGKFGVFHDDLILHLIQHYVLEGGSKPIAAESVRVALTLATCNRNYKAFMHASMTKVKFLKDFMVYIRHPIWVRQRNDIQFKAFSCANLLDEDLVFSLPVLPMSLKHVIDALRFSLSMKCTFCRKNNGVPYYDLACRFCPACFSVMIISDVELIRREGVSNEEIWVLNNLIPHQDLTVASMTLDNLGRECLTFTAHYYNIMDVRAQLRNARDIANKIERNMRHSKHHEL